MLEIKLQVEAAPELLQALASIAHSLKQALPSEPKITVNEAAKRIGVHPRTIRRKLADGTLTTHGLKGSPRIDPQELVQAKIQPDVIEGF